MGKWFLIKMFHTATVFNYVYTTYKGIKPRLYKNLPAMKKVTKLSNITSSSSLVISSSAIQKLFILLSHISNDPSIFTFKDIDFMCFSLKGSWTNWLKVTWICVKHHSILRNMNSGHETWITMNTFFFTKKRFSESTVKYSGIHSVLIDVTR